MNPIFIDVILIVLSVLLIVGGWRQGFVRAAGSLIGLVISIGIGIWGVGWIENLTGFNLTGNPMVFIVSFLFLSFIVSQLIGFVVSALDLVRKLISVIPFLGLLNRFLGAGVGVAQASVMIGAIAFVMSNFVPAGGVRTVFMGSELIKVALEVESVVGILGGTE